MTNDHHPPQEATEEAQTSPGASHGTRMGRSAAFFSVATATARVTGLIREIVAASYFGVTGPMSAFTIAYQLPNLIRSLVTDGALLAAFVPVFTEQLERGQRRNAFRLAATLLFVLILGLGALTATLIVLAPVVMPLLTPGFESQLTNLTVALSRLLFPLVFILGIAGFLVAVLNSYDRFALGAVSPIIWNGVSVACLVGLAPVFPEADQIYAYAIGYLAGTLLQLIVLLPDLRRTPFRFTRALDLTSPYLRRMLFLAVPMVVSVGLINFNFLISALVGTLVSDRAPAAIDKAFKVYTLPQGVFALAVTTVVFPTLARLAAREDYARLRELVSTAMRQLVFVLVPTAGAILVLSVPITRLLFERGEFDPSQTRLVATALFWFALSLPFNGIFLLLTRTLFSLQRPWAVSAVAGANLALTASLALALHEPFGIAGIVGATGIATAASAMAASLILRRVIGGLGLRRLLGSATRVLTASCVLAAVAHLVWSSVDVVVGHSVQGQLVSTATGLAAGAAAYLVVTAALNTPELQQMRTLVRGRGTQSQAPL